MGVDLALVPKNDPPIGVWFLAYERIDLDRQNSLFAAVRKVKQHDLPSTTRFEWYSDSGLEVRTTDQYNEPLKYIFAGDLAAVKLPKDTTQKNKAVWAFLRGLDPATPIVLWWH